MWSPGMLGARRSLRTHLLLLRPRCLGGCPALLALHLRFGGHTLALRRGALRSSGRFRGSFGQRLFLCRCRGLLLCWGRARGPALLGSPEAPCGRGLPLGGCRRLGGRRRGCFLLLDGGRRLVPWGASGRLLWGRQRHRGRVAEAAFEQPLSLAVQAQPFVLLQNRERKSSVQTRGALSQQGSHREVRLMGHTVMGERTRPTQTK